jgi:hypothetical protein
MNITDIRRALAHQVAVGIGRTFTGYPYDSGACLPPCVVVTAGDPYITYHVTSGDNCIVELELQLEVRCASADQQSAQIVLDDVLTPGRSNGNSIIEAVEADNTLSGTVGNCWVSSASAPFENENGYFVSVLDVHILTNKAS